MNLPVDQLSKVLNSAQNILVVGPVDPSVDVISTAIAWAIFLMEKKKKVDVVMSGRLPKLNFLPKDIKIESQIEPMGKFKIIVDVSKIKIKQLSYDVKDDQLQIDLIPQDGSFKPSDVQGMSNGYKYDLIICLGVPSLESMGEVFAEHRSFFHKTQIMNIDRSVANENFGQLNIVESIATSIAEISYTALHKYLNKDMATALLAGMISATNSFQSPQVTPQTLELASQLMINGADRASVIESLYRTKDIDVLKTWGKVLSRLHKSNSIIVSFLQHDEPGHLPEDFQELVKELILATPYGQVAMIFYPLNFETTEIWLYTISNINALELSKEFSGIGNRQFVKFSVDKNLDDSQDYVIKQIQAKLDLINKE